MSMKHILAIWIGNIMKVALKDVQFSLMENGENL